jgi:hypothetical protein
MSDNTTNRQRDRAPDGIRNPVPAAPPSRDRLPRRVLLVSRDLFFPSRLPSLGPDWELRCGALSNSPESPAPSVVLIDLDAYGEQAYEVIDTARSHYPRCWLVAFGSHVHGDRLRRATERGCDVSVSRGELAKSTHSLFATWRDAMEQMN